MSNLFNNIQIVLCNTSHPGNIGSAARAMKTMGLTRLCLVDPLVAADDHALALSCNAKDVVSNATYVNGLANAISNSHLSIAMTGRKREFNQRLQTPKQIVAEILATSAAGAQVSIVFGNEQNGLSIEQLEQCNRLVTIPGNPEYFSLNLAQAVQIMAYEIYSNFKPDLHELKTAVKHTTQQDIQHLLSSIDQVLATTKFYHGKNSQRSRRRLQHILQKAELTREDVDLVHGVLRALNQHSQG